MHEAWALLSHSDESLQTILDWLTMTSSQLNETNLNGDLQTVKALVAETQVGRSIGRSLVRLG